MAFHPVSYHLLLLCLLLSTWCQANTIPTIKKASRASSEKKSETTDDDAATIQIQSITSQVSSWMKDKRKKDKKRNNYQDIEEDIPLQRQQQYIQKDILSRPFVTLSYAQTLDGMIAALQHTGISDGGTTTSTSSNLLLSCPESMSLTHHLRNMHDAILVGGSTFLSDKPRLNCRLQSLITVDDPMPIVLDTHLNNLQRLLFDEIVSIESEEEDTTLPDINIDTIKADNPIFCCSSNAAKSFLDTLEVFQEQQETKRKRRKSYKITVCKKIDVNGDHERDIYLPIKITIHVTTHNKKSEEDTVQDITLTLLPCQVHTHTKSLDLKHVLHELYNQFAIESIMVEGGAAILSSFMNECVDTNDDNSKVVDCICITTAPKIIGGKWGLPAFSGLDVPCIGDGDTSVKNSDHSENGSDRMLQPGVVNFKDCEFKLLGRDSIFLGRI